MKQRQSHWGIWPRLHVSMEVNCLVISCTWGTNASSSNNRLTKSSVNAMKLGTSRAAYIQTTLSGNLGCEVCSMERRFTRAPQALSVCRFLIMVLSISVGAVALLARTRWFYCTSWSSDPLCYTVLKGGCEQYASIATRDQTPEHSI